MSRTHEVCNPVPQESRVSSEELEDWYRHFLLFDLTVENSVGDELSGTDMHTVVEDPAGELFL